MQCGGGSYDIDERVNNRPQLKIVGEPVLGCCLSTFALLSEVTIHLAPPAPRILVIVSKCAPHLLITADVLLLPGALPRFQQPEEDFGMFSE